MFALYLNLRRYSVESAAAPVAWEGMRSAGQVPSFAVMLAVAAGMAGRIPLATS